MHREKHRSVSNINDSKSIPSDETFGLVFVRQVILTKLALCARRVDAELDTGETCKELVGKGLVQYLQD